MKAIVVNKYGSPNELATADIPTPKPKAGEILIKVNATTVSAGDCEIRRFQIPFLFWLPLRFMLGLFRPKQLVLGQEYAGVIEEVGEGVKNFRIGDRVFGPTKKGLGSYAAYYCLPKDGVIAKMPDSLNFYEAATIPLGGFNALYFVEMANIQAGEKVLINGAAGSIGVVAVQLAKMKGARVVAVDSTYKLKLLQQLGADEVLDYTTERFTNNRSTYDVVFDIVGKSSFWPTVHTLRKNGRYVHAHFRPFFMLQALVLKCLSSKRAHTGLAFYTNERLKILKDLFGAGKLKAPIDRIFSLEEMADAHAYVDAGHKTGHVVIKVAEPV